MPVRDKILNPEKLGEWREVLRRAGQRLVVTNGCFDLLHAGHVLYLEAARSKGDVLLVGVNGDDSVRSLKGPGRPVVPEEDRALVVAALSSVNAVCVFPETRAQRFLSVAKPDVYVKGGDYTLDTLDPEERQTLQAGRSQIIFIPIVKGRSTSCLFERILKL